MEELRSLCNPLVRDNLLQHSRDERQEKREGWYASLLGLRELLKAPSSKLPENLRRFLEGGKITAIRVGNYRRYRGEDEDSLLKMVVSEEKQAVEEEKQEGRAAWVIVVENPKGKILAVKLQMEDRPEVKERIIREAAFYEVARGIVQNQILGDAVTIPFSFGCLSVREGERVGLVLEYIEGETLGRTHYEIGENVPGETVLRRIFNAVANFHFTPFSKWEELLKDKLPSIIAPLQRGEENWDAQAQLSDKKGFFSGRSEEISQRFQDRKEKIVNWLKEAGYSEKEIRELQNQWERLLSDLPTLYNSIPEEELTLVNEGCNAGNFIVKNGEVFQIDWEELRILSPVCGFAPILAALWQNKLFHDRWLVSLGKRLRQHYDKLYGEDSEKARQAYERAVRIFQAEMVLFRYSGYAVRFYEKELQDPSKKENALKARKQLAELWTQALRGEGIWENFLSYEQIQKTESETF